MKSHNRNSNGDSQGLDHAARAIQKAAERIRTQVSQSAQQIDNAFKPLRESAEQTRLAFQAVSETSKAFSQWQIDLQRAARSLPEKLLEAGPLLASDGWYLDREMLPSQALNLGKMLAEGGTLRSEARRHLCAHFNERAESPTRLIAPASSSRQPIVESALRAHAEGRYELSIPVLLAQADGHAAEQTNLSLFLTREKRPVLAPHLENIAKNPWHLAMYAPLIDCFPIMFSSAQRAAITEPIALNRHAVLHGEDCEYGTLENSARAISLWIYVTWILPQ